MAQVRILCVGDGDLTFSLALVRAYGTDQVDVTASTLLSSRDELLETYSNSKAVLEELLERNVKVLFGVDATQIHSQFASSSDTFDVVIFSHPHLGLETLEESEAWHAERHRRLLSHYLWSAAQCSRSIHICLCGRQPQTWRLLEAATRSNLRIQGNFQTHLPPSTCWLANMNKNNNLTELPTQPQYSAPRKYRNGKLGSKHYLGKFGYQHRPTHPVGGNATVNVESSVHFVFVPTTTTTGDEAPQQAELQCQICAATFESEEEIRQHEAAPARPTAVVVRKQQEAGKSKQSSSERTTTSKEQEDSTVKPECGPVVEWTGNAAISGRLRQSLRASMKKLSKKQAQDRIKYGCVKVNGILIQDSARMVTVEDTLQVCELVVREAALTVDVIHQNGEDWLVAMKPVGMRAIGTFANDTLESVVSQQLQNPYRCRSKLDIGCSGLCVLQKKGASVTLTSIHRVFTVLVYGKVDFKETTLKIDSGSSRSWRRKKKKLRLDQDENEADKEEDAVAPSEDVSTEQTVSIVCGETCSDPPLSTLTITSTNPDLKVDALMFALRNTLGAAVVNDRFWNKEYTALPRSMRNRLKQRLCIVCSGVVVVVVNNDKEEVISIPTSERLSAQHWQRHCAVAAASTSTND